MHLQPLDRKKMVSYLAHGLKVLEKNDEKRAELLRLISNKCMPVNGAVPAICAAPQHATQVTGVYYWW